jgi:hypothetical protein
MTRISSKFRTGLAASLARPVARGLLAIEHARAAIAVAIIKGVRDGTSPGTGTLEEKLNIDRHIFDLHLQIEAARRERVIGAISRVLRPLIDLRAPRGRLLAEAHDCNADSGFPLFEPEVKEIAKIQVYWGIERSRRHAR